MSESGSKLYRIISFERAVEIFKLRQLFFAHPSQWEDPYETHIEYDDSHLFFAQCWGRKAVSDAMWRIYSPDKLSIRIRTTQEKLIEQIHLAKLNAHFGFNLRRVSYPLKPEFDEKIQAIAMKFGVDKKSQTAANSLFLKRHAFQHEAEVRAVIYDLKRDPSISKESGFRLNIDPHRLIESILFDPRAPDSYVEACTYYFENKLNYSKYIGKSELYNDKDKIDLRRKKKVKDSD